ncbi:coatomer subunit [Plasmopara halstedii]|uniref:Coatomer subunit gamma n=1 Tax=Plasmopara halstedii TaxID=4781 RepID=A0A0N7L4T1_PLAHL|nr:coatomer subunit [Plasmopara halstedii]CEG39539.1 coatomer subunit [Plasmopara halstedii]|eukprot:XP_024575908.1 coatomer subunit [Plasmopara halstedii]
MKLGASQDTYGAGSDSARSASAISISSVMADIKEKFKNDEEEQVSPFQGLDKATVLQETKIFSDANTVTRHPKKCCQLITKLLHILTQGEPFTSAETTAVFFGVTKLFQSKDANLRRMMYLFIKEVAEATAADEVIIVTQSLTKDMSSDVDLYRANAIRVLCRIIDGSMLNAIERYIKQAIVDRNALVASSALVAGIHLIKNNSEIVRRWVNEVQEAVNSTNDMVQYHGVSLLYHIRQHDKLAVSKFITQLQKTSLRSNLATCLLIRYTTTLLRDNAGGQDPAPLYSFLQKMLYHKNEMVLYEAARALCTLPVDSRDLTQAIVVLQLFLSSSKPTLRFAAVRTLSQVALTQPMLVTRCNEDMEALITDSNRSIATLAITTLLKTGAESSVDRLMKQISTFMGDIADEFKIVVVEAIKNLCVKYPQKHRVLLNFLANFLREEGGFDFKKTITDAILFLIERIQECKDSALLHLCEFIEDCEFTQLSTKILRVLGQKGPTTSVPARYIRFIRNRVILENAPVRASAVSALAQFAIRVASLRVSISSLLQCCKLDDDDEVRDRATMYLSILNGDEVISRALLVEDFPICVATLQKSIEQYELRLADGPLTFEALPHVDVDEVVVESSIDDAEADIETIQADTVPEPQDVAKELYTIPEFAELGALFRSSKRLELTEAETEYVVSCTKHVFAQHLVLQFKVLNTVSDQLLTNVRVEFVLEPEDVWQVQSVIPVSKLAYGKTGSCYVCLRFTGDGVYPVVQLANVELLFKVHEVNPSSGEVEDDGFDEEYPMENLEIGASDLMAKVSVNDFRSAWESIGDSAEVKGSFGLKYKTLVEGVAAVIENLGMQPCENTAVPQPKARAHILLLSGVFVGGVKSLVKSRISLDEQSDSLILQMAVRTEMEEISQTIMDCIR